MKPVLKGNFNPRLAIAGIFFVLTWSAFLLSMAPSTFLSLLKDMHSKPDCRSLHARL